MPEPSSPAPQASIFPIPASAVRASLPGPLQAHELGLDWDRLVAANGQLEWRMVKADGVTQAAACLGNGSPTVVYLDGMGAPAAETWAPVAVAQSATNRVCLFDRPGMGLSPDRADPETPKDPAQHAAELVRLVGALGESGPFVLVGWDYGGLVARAAAMAAPEEVAGLVLVDHSPPSAEYLVKETDAGDTPGIWWGDGHPIDMRTAVAKIGSGPHLGNVPVVVLQQGDPGVPADEFDLDEWTREQGRATTISDNALHVVAHNSDHVIPVRNPEAVLAATDAVSESVRAGNTPLPACPAGLVAAGATCSDDS